MFAYSVLWLLLFAVLTFDFSCWCAPYRAATPVVVLLLALFAFKTALGGRKLFRTDSFEDWTPVLKWIPHCVQLYS